MITSRQTKTEEKAGGGFASPSTNFKDEKEEEKEKEKEKAWTIQRLDYLKIPHCHQWWWFFQSKQKIKEGLKTWKKERKN